MTIKKYGTRFWAVWDGDNLVCVALYKKGALEVVRRLDAKNCEEVNKDEDRPDPSCA